MGYRVAVVGATGNVGREIMQIMVERNFPADEVVALASERSVGKEVSYGDTAVLKVQNLADFDCPFPRCTRRARRRPARW
jgi:aspartate-semialdehyde dehydrogenase